MDSYLYRGEILLLFIKKKFIYEKIDILKGKGIDIPCSIGLSVQLKNKRVRFETAQQILDYSGYKSVIEEK